MKYFIWSIYLLALPVLLTAQPVVTIKSPGKKCSLQIHQSIDGRIQYALSYKNQPVVLPSGLGFTLNRPALELDRFDILQVDSIGYDNTWQPVWGEVATIRDQHRQLTLHLRDAGAGGFLLNVVFRLFDDGLGFRYEFPEQAGFRHLVIGAEKTDFTLTGNHTAFWIPGDYDTNEYLYNTTKLREINALAAAAKEKDIAVQALIGPNAVQTPLMLKSDNGLYINLHRSEEHTSELQSH